MPRRGAVLLLALFIPALALAREEPCPPRNGRNSVQMIIGGRNDIPMCIVPPRQYVSGARIPNGTRVTISVFRSYQEGKAGTYTEKVGESSGMVEQPWLDLSANVPPGKGNTFYLASCATINGVTSALNNQWLTVQWWPGGFKVLVSPPSGSGAGRPPSGSSTRPAVPDWLVNIAQPRTPTSGAGGWILNLPPLSKLHKWLPGLQQAWTLTLHPGKSGQATGAFDLKPIQGYYEHPDAGWHWGNSTQAVKGSLSSSAANILADCAFTLTDPPASQSRTQVHLTLKGALRGDNTMGGTLHSVVTITTNNLKPEQQVTDLPFTGTRQSGRAAAEVSAAFAGPFRSDLGRPGPLYPSPVAEAIKPPRNESPEEYKRWMRDAFCVGTIRMEVGETRNFAMSSRITAHYNLATKEALPVRAGTYDFEPPTYFVENPSVLQELNRKGGVLEAKAMQPGRAEVWSRRYGIETFADGTTEKIMQTNIWLILVGPAAVIEYKRYQHPTAVSIPSIDVPRAEITGRAVMRGTGKPVVGAFVTLIGEQNRPVSKPTWRTDTKGEFRIVAEDLLKSDRYEVLLQKLSADGATVGPDNDLWTVKKHRILITLESAARGAFKLGDMPMDTVSNIDFPAR